MSTNPQLSDHNTNILMGPRWVADIKKDWPTDRRCNITLIINIELDDSRYRGSAQTA
jgi:hypothetical protein